MSKWKVGNSYKGFTVTKSLPVEEIDVRLIELVHKSSGAKVVHLANDDEENVFCISFQTLPSSSNGAPHILEHTVLCGSKKFPVKDPFFSMARRSLNTFMNAFTGSDFTCYPASSQVKNDFYNILEVYLDAIFFPNLNKLSFLQEGHRLEFLDPKDPNSLCYKGVVFNEMKGAMSTPDSRFWQKMMENLTPDIPYSFNSGGEPAEIPTLTHEELIDFHKNYYHPSNALFYFYGNLPLEGHLDFIEEQVLEKKHAKSPIAPIAKQPRFSSPKICEGSIPMGEEDSGSMIGFGWLTAPVTDPERVLALALIDSLLMETDASLLHEALISSDLMTSAEAHLDTEMSEVPWVILCRGADPKDADKIRKIIFTELEKTVQRKFTEEELEAALHQLEFSRLEITQGSYPYGLSLFFRSALLKQHGLDPEHGLMIHSLFEKLRHRLKDPEYLSLIIYEEFVNNPHFVQLTMTPDKELLSIEEKQEKESLKNIANRLTDIEREIIIDQTNTLSAYQEEQEHQSLECLPQIEISDIPHKGKDFALTCKNNHYFHPTFTNHIIHADLLFPFPEMSREEIPYLSLFSSLLTEIGTTKTSWQEELHKINLSLGGFESYLSLSVDSRDPEQMSPLLAVRGKALERNGEKLFEIFANLKNLDFTDQSRIETLLKNHHTYLESRLTKNAMRYAAALAASSTRVSANLQEILYGYSHVETVRKLIKGGKKALHKAIDLFEDWKKIFTHEAELVISSSKEAYHLLEKEDFYGLSLHLNKKGKPFKFTEKRDPVRSAYLVSSPVAFTAQGLSTVPYSDPSAPAILAAAHLMHHTTLHKEIREKGGAYGSGANYNSAKGHIIFTSYRDPNLASTLESFEKSVNYIKEERYEESELFDAKLSIIQDFDAPTAPGSKGVTAYFWQRNHLTYEKRDAFRKKVLSLTSSDITKALKEVPFDFKNSSVVSFADKKFFDKENAKLTKPLVIQEK